MTTRIVKKILKATQYQKEKHNKTVTLARTKLNSKGSKLFEALINNEISHQDFLTIINEKKTIKNYQTDEKSKK